MITEHELSQRLTRVEQELSAVKQQLGALLMSHPPAAALLLLEQLWQIESTEKPALTLPEARERLTHGLSTRWGSQLIKQQRAQR
jgi:hypothetical protein